MNSLRHRMRKWRLSHDLTQRVAASVVGISHSQWTKVESGQRVPSYREIQRLDATMAEIDRSRRLRLVDASA